MSVDEMLAASVAASLSIPTLWLIMLISAFNNIFPNISIITDVIEEEEYILLFENPLLVLGLIDLTLAVILFFKVSEIYPYATVPGYTRLRIFRVLPLGRSGLMVKPIRCS